MKYILYLITFSTICFSCQKEVSVDLNNPPAPSAVFSFGGAPNACAGATTNGSYVAGIALTTSNTVDIQGNVTGVGDYTITTATVNGYKFSATGTFTATGNQTITLTGTGTPAAAQANHFSPSASGITRRCFIVT